MVDAYTQNHNEDPTEMDVMFSIISESSMINWIEQSFFAHTMEPQLSFEHRKAILPLPLYVNVEFSSF